MVRIARLPALRVALAATVMFSLVLAIRPTPDTASAGEVPSRLALHLKGTSKREPTPESDRFQWTFDLYSLATGEKVGTATTNDKATGPGTFEQITTFHLPDGDLVTRHEGDFAPSTNPSHSGFIFMSVRPDEKTILAEKGTGNYAGRTGRVQISGWNDLTKLPGEVTFDDFYLIELDPKA